jgi:hypothetical protein
MLILLLFAFQVKYLVNKARIWKPKKPKDDKIKGMSLENSWYYSSANVAFQLQ